MSGLAEKSCVPCKGDVPALTGESLKGYQKQLGRDWKIAGEHHLEREFKFKDFKTALAFTNRVGELAEKAGHHPDIELSWGKVKVVLWTHKVGGLTESDFILAAKIDQLEE